jgi:hypothetical protein
MVPYVFWTLERLFERRTAGATSLLAIVVACQALAGEPVSLFATLVIAGAYAVLPQPRRKDWVWPSGPPPRLAPAAARRHPIPAAGARLARVGS